MKYYLMNKKEVFYLGKNYFALNFSIQKTLLYKILSLQQIISIYYSMLQNLENSCLASIVG